MCSLPTKVEFCEFSYLDLIFFLLSNLSFAPDLPEASLDLCHFCYLMQLKNHPQKDSQGNPNSPVRETEHPDVATARAPLESSQMGKGPSPPRQRSDGGQPNPNLLIRQRGAPSPGYSQAHHGRVLSPPSRWETHHRDEFWWEMPSR